VRNAAGIGRRSSCRRTIGHKSKLNYVHFVSFEFNDHHIAAALSRRGNWDFVAEKWPEAGLKGTWMPAR
jgi:hypothetical protein